MYAGVPITAPVWVCPAPPARLASPKSVTRGWRARYTTPIPPRPSSPSTTYPGGATGPAGSGPADRAAAHASPSGDWASVPWGESAVGEIPSPGRVSPPGTDAGRDPASGQVAG